MALKKPSEYFKKDIPSVDNSIQEVVKSPELNTFSDAFQSFKNNLSKIEVLSDFSETLDNYRVNIERVNHLSSSIGDIKTEIQSLLKKEDLDRAMMSQLLVVEQSIQEVQNKVNGINEKNLTEIRLDVAGLTENINKFLEVEVPKYKKLVVDSELRSNTRYEELEENINQTLEGIGEFVDNKYQQLTESLKGINEKSLAGILEDFKLLENNLEKLKEEEIPRYKGFIVETERKVDSKLEKVDQSVNEKIHQIEASLTQFDESVDQKIQNIQTTLSEFIKIESPKYSKLLIENKLKTEEEVKVLQENISEKVSQFVKDIEILKNSALQESQDINTFVTERIDEFKQTLNETQKDVKKTLSTYTSISKTFENKVTLDNERIDFCENTLNQVSQKIEDCLSQILVFKEDVEIQQEIESEWKESLKKEILKTLDDYQSVFDDEIGLVQEDLSKKLSDLQLEIVRNETHIRVQNKTLQEIQEEVKNTLSEINLEKIQEQNHKLGNKVKYLEEVFEKFSEKEILTENIIVEPPSTDNQDSLTPLDKNFVTLEQLQEHYRLFINRIQQQLATIGGGGETRLEFLDDIDRDSAKINGRFLKYDSDSGKWIGAIAGGSGGSQTLNDTLGLGNTSTYGMSVGVVTATSFVKFGGTSNQFLKADGSVDSSTYLTSYSETDTLNTVTTRGSSTSNGISVGVLTATTGNFSGIITSSGANISGVVTATDFNSASDIRLKNNINIIDKPLDKVLKLEGVNFEWKNNGKKSLGVIAQEVEKILPELVSGEENKTVNYNGLVGLLIECVKEQQKEIEELKKNINK